MEAKKWIGIDIHKKQFTVCIILMDGKKLLKIYERNENGIAEFLEQVDKDTIIGIESTTWTWDLVKKILPKAKDVIILNTIELKSLMDKMKKTDTEDAKRIAVIIQRFEKEELSICQIKEDDNAEIKGLLNIREELVRTSTRYKNQIISTLEFWGIKSEKKWFTSFKKDIEFISQSKIPDSIKTTIYHLYSLLEHINDETKNIDNEVEKLCKNKKGYNEIVEEIGIGKTTGAYLISKIADIKRFENPKKLTSYLGLVPKVSTSDGKGTNGRITKKTDKAFLRVIIQAAWARVRWDKNMKAIFDNIKTRAGKQKAIVAIARKMVVLIFYKLKNIENKTEK